MFSDDSPGATNTRVANFESRSMTLTILINKIIYIDGHLVAWQYYIGHNVNACTSYAVIWRKNGDVYHRITETELKPEEPSTGGIRFQYVQDADVVVQQGDVIGFYVGSDSNCSGNLISFYNGDSRNTDNKALNINSDKRTTRPLSVIPSSDTFMQHREASLKAYVAGECAVLYFEWVLLVISLPLSVNILANQN